MFIFQMGFIFHGPNYTMAPKSLPITEYVAVIGQACSKLQQGEAEELRGESNPSLRKHTVPPTSPRKK